MADSEDKKPEKKEGGEGSLNIRIRDQTGEETFFKVKKTTKLDKVFNAYSTRKGVAARAQRVRSSAFSFSRLGRLSAPRPRSAAVG